MVVEKTKIGCSYYTIFIVESQYRFLHKTYLQVALKNLPESIVECKKMMYNKPNEYKLMETDFKSVNSGIMLPLIRYEKYKEYHEQGEKQ